METNNELRTAWDFAEHTGVSIFLTGKAGTGKTTFLKTLKEHTAKTVAVVAPTGVAAINAGGATIHSFFQIAPTPFLPGASSGQKFNFSKQKLRIIRALDMLVIDEISMVRSDLLDAVDDVLRRVRRSPLPFGGVQLLMIGDLQQLAPVVTPADEALLRGHYSTPYFFGSRALALIPYVTICLTKVYRQQNASFVELLNHVRDAALTPADFQALAGRLDPTFRPQADSGYIRLTTHNQQADDYNAAQLLMLPGKSRVFTARIQGTFPEYAYPTAQSLRLKVGAQVMFVRNDPEHRYYNGRIGRVVDISPTSLRVLCPGDTEPIEVEEQVWENATYTINDETRKVETTVQGTFSQVPLRLAWAITIHKSQGLTFDKVIIDAGRSFAPGQVYVALSRCKTLEGIVLSTPITSGQVLSDPAVTSYTAGQDAEAARSIERLADIKSAYYRQLLCELFTFRDITDPQQSLARHIAQTYARSFPEETAAHQALVTALREKVTDVADKWLQMLRAAPDDALREPGLLSRVGRGAVYFEKTLSDLFADLLDRTAKVKTENKRANQRLQDLNADLRAALGARRALLESIAREGFTISNYLNAKQAAIIEASADNDSKAKAGRRNRKARTAKGKATKEPKEKSSLITYRMFRQGMTRAEIASERNLAVSTITSHLATFIPTGELTVDDILTPSVCTQIASAVRRAGLASGYAGIQALLPASITPSDIRLYLNNTPSPEP